MESGSAADGDLAGGDPGANAHALDASANRGDGGERTPRVVILRNRRAEHRDDAVAAGGLDAPAGFLELANRRLHHSLGRRCESAGDDRRQLHLAPLPADVPRSRSGAVLQGRVVPQDRPLEVPECRTRLEAELADEDTARVAVRGERVGRPAGPVQGQHQLSARAFPQRFGLDQRLELGDQLGVAPQRQLGLHQLLTRRHAELLQPRRLRPRERLVREVREGRPTPERQRPPER